MKKRANSGRKLNHLATRVFNTPLLIARDKIEVILRGRIGARLGLRDALAFDDEGMDAEEIEGSSYCVENGIACIPIHGTLVKRSTGMDALSGLTSYEELTEQITDAATDPNVKGILLDVDSPGGEAAGMFDLADLIFSLRGQKPMFAVSNDSMFSAAYALGSAADQVWVTREGGVGSIGCYMLHVDQSEYDKKEGLKFEYIQSGDKKTEGNPHEPLSSEARATFQDMVDRIGGMFVSLVARNRAISADAVTAMQAGVFPAETALPMLADKVGNFDEAMSAMQAKIGALTDDAEIEESGIFAPSLLSVDRAKSGTMTLRFNVDATQLQSALDKIRGSFDALAIEAALARMEPERKTLVARYGAQVQSAILRFPECRSSVGNDSRRISMLVVPYGQQSCDLGGFREVYERGCFLDGLGEDPRAMFNHNPDYVLGRESSGTARFYEDAAGVHCEVPDAPETSWADDLLVSMRRGDIGQASAAFFILQHRWETRSGQRIRVVERALMREASVVSFAAYESTQAIVQPAPVAVAAHLHELEQAGARLQLLKVS